MIFNSLLRNKIAVLTVLCATVLFTACGSDALSDPLTREDETYVGEFKSLGGIEVQDLITHLFETEDGDVLYAYSERYDLDSSDYENTDVEAYGVVTTYENLDKPLFEVKRITDAPEEDEDSEEVTMLDFQDPDLGFSMSYPSNWTLKSDTSSVILLAPVVVSEEDTSEDDLMAEEPVNEKGTGPVSDEFVDIIVIFQMEADLVKSSEDTQEDRATEVRNYVTAHYASLATAESELAYVGTDRLFSVRYKTANGDVFYFIPRAEKLYELSYNHESDSDADRLENSNTFATLASGFRFTPYGAAPEPTEEPEVKEETPVEEPKETSTPAVEGQVTFNSYRELESKPYEFKMSYPGNWYYAGSSTGYTFSDTSTDDENSEAILTMTFNSGAAVGTSRSGETVSVTVEVEGRKYTISGPAEYQSAMQIMADSITSTATDDEA